MKINLTRNERRQLDETIYEIFPEIEDYEAGKLDRTVESIILDRVLAIEDQMEVARLKSEIDLLRHNVRATYYFTVASHEPEKWCISGRCEDTNWGGRDRLHVRGASCPEFSPDEITGYLRQAGAI